MELLMRDLFICLFLLLLQIMWLPTASLLYYMWIYNADWKEIKDFLNQTTFLQTMFNMNGKGFNLIGFSTTGSIRQFLKYNRIPKFMFEYIRSLIIIIMVLLAAFYGIRRTYGTNISIFYLGIAIIQIIISLRMMLFGRRLKHFVKNKSKLVDRA